MTSSISEEMFEIFVFEGESVAGDAYSGISKKGQLDT